MSDNQSIKLDSGGLEALKPAVIALLNEYPALGDREITFQGLTENGGISIEPESGTLVYSEMPDIIGNVYQECQFPFLVVYRSNASSEYLKLNIHEFLDNLGAWLSMEPVNIDGTYYQLTAYPELPGNRKIKNIVRYNSYVMEENENQTQDWVIPITVNYTHKFTKW